MPPQSNTTTSDSNKKQRTGVNHTNAMWKNEKAPIVPVTILTGFLGSGKVKRRRHRDFFASDNGFSMSFRLKRALMSWIGLGQFVSPCFFYCHSLLYKYMYVDHVDESYPQRQYSWYEIRRHWKWIWWSWDRRTCLVGKCRWRSDWSYEWLYLVRCSCCFFFLPFCIFGRVVMKSEIFRLVDRHISLTLRLMFRIQFCSLDI